MDKTACLDLFAFTDYAWGQIRETLSDDDVLTRAAPGSGWPALRNCFGHMVLAYERWLPAIIDLKAEAMPKLQPDDFETWAQIEEHRSRLRDELRHALETWSDADLAALHDVDVDGEPIRYSRGELVAHLLLHERGHHGDVTTLLWQLGFDPDIALEYRFYLGRV
jgi:uncharacterized damage-inducible protein DinB